MHKGATIATGTLIALAVLAAPVAWQLAKTPQPDIDRFTKLRSDTDALRQEIIALRARVDGLDARTAIDLRAVPPADLPRLPKAGPAPELPDPLRQNFAQVVQIADRRDANAGLSVASPRFLRDTFGPPRADLTNDCQGLTNPNLRALIATEDVGPIRARLLTPALASLRGVFAEVATHEPALYDRIASSGSLCVRLIRGSAAAASAHGYGLAVDLNIDGELDPFADGQTQLGLILLADFFHRAGWIWGAGFSREDSMHFEVSREKIEEWRALGLL
ncbi:M15 family metallopeptidase [Roseobacter sp.]|uniref:M15 family metallopeptidase n=1 Tax=Roseobacter sp. TaxID=1907202 RepID=UPI00329A3474